MRNNFEPFNIMQNKGQGITMFGTTPLKGGMQVYSSREIRRRMKRQAKKERIRR